MILCICMASKRNLVFINDGIYHIFNRGIERRPIFMNRREFVRAKQLIEYYHYQNIPVRFSHFLYLSVGKQKSVLSSIRTDKKLVEVLCYCLMPNHFHFLLRQKNENGIQTFLSKFSNAY